MTEHRQHRAPNDAGFSLVEALVALTIFAFAAMALLQVQGESARATVALEEKLIAEIVADNVLAEAMLLNTPLERPNKGETDLAGRKWLWSLTAKPLPDRNLAVIEVVVTQAATGQEVYRVSTIKGATHGS